MLRFALALCLLAAPAVATDYAVGDTFDDPLQIARDAFAGFAYEEEGRPAMSVDVSVDFFGAMTILVAETGFADDSVNGQRYQYVLSQTEGVWTLTVVQSQFLCYRGTNTVTWQTDLCP